MGDFTTAVQWCWCKVRSAVVFGGHSPRIPCSVHDAGGSTPGTPWGSISQLSVVGMASRPTSWWQYSCR